MILKFDYLKAERIGYLSMWQIDGLDEDGGSVRLYVDHVANKPAYNATYIEAKDVVVELEDKMFTFKDEIFLDCRKECWWNPDMPRNLAKSVTVS